MCNQGRTTSSQHKGHRCQNLEKYSTNRKIYSRKQCLSLVIDTLLSNGNLPVSFYELFICKNYRPNWFKLPPILGNANNPPSVPLQEKEDQIIYHFER